MVLVLGLDGEQRLARVGRQRGRRVVRGVERWARGRLLLTLLLSPRARSASSLAGDVFAVVFVVVGGVGVNGVVFLGATRQAGRCVGVLEAELSLSALLLVQVLLGDGQLEETVPGLAGV